MGHQYIKGHHAYTYSHVGAIQPGQSTHQHVLGSSVEAGESKSVYLKYVYNQYVYFFIYLFFTKNSFSKLQYWIKSLLGVHINRSCRSSVSICSLAGFNGRSPWNIINTRDEPHDCTTPLLSRAHTHTSLSLIYRELPSAFDLYLMKVESMHVLQKLFLDGRTPSCDHYHFQTCHSLAPASNVLETST